MQVYGILLLQDFATAHPECRGAVAAWILEAREAVWTTAREVQERYTRAKVSAGGRVVFDLHLGLYLICALLKYDKGIVLVERAWFNGQPPKLATRASKK